MANFTVLSFGKENNQDTIPFSAHPDVAFGNTLGGDPVFARANLAGKTGLPISFQRAENRSIYQPG